MEENNKILIYTDSSGLTKIDVRLTEDTLWLTQAQMCELYQTSKSNVSEHIKHIFEEGELDREVVVRKFRTTSQHGAIEGMTQTHEVTFYNLDMIIALGYRVRSIIATRFRQWATEHATNEYRKYKQRTISDVEQDYLDAIKRLGNIAKDDESKEGGK